MRLSELAARFDGYDPELMIEADDGHPIEIARVELGRYGPHVIAMLRPASDEDED